MVTLCKSENTDARPQLHMGVPTGCMGRLQIIQVPVTAAAISLEIEPAWEWTCERECIVQIRRQILRP